MDKSAPSKESLERAQKWVARKGFQWPESAMEWLALEFDAIRRERDEVAEKLEALRDSVIEECKKVVCDISEMYEKKKEGRVRIAESHEWSAFFICLALDELKGAPR